MMKIQFFCPYWGSENLDFKTFLYKVRKAGYDGVEMSLPMESERRKAISGLLQSSGMQLIAQHWETSTADFGEHKVEFHMRLVNLARANPLFINTQTGKDFFSFQQNAELIEIADKISQTYGVKIIHETHRGKFSFAPHITFGYLTSFPGLRLGMFPLVPYNSLPRLHDLMKDDCPKPYSGIIETFKEIIPTLLKQRKDLSYCIERKLPEKRPYKQEEIRNRFFGNKATLSDGRIEVCNLSDLPKGEVVRFDFNQKTYAVYRTADDRFYATEGICTHGNAHLSEGVVIGEMIECAKHNGRFSLKDGSPKRTPVCVSINTYKTVADNGKIYLTLKALNEKEPDKELTYKVVSNNNVTPFIKELVLEPSDKETLIFKPGQYIQLLIPPHRIEFKALQIGQPFWETWRSMNLFNYFAENTLFTRRNYSMATNHVAEKQLRFNIRISFPPPGENVTAGAGSSYVFNLKPNDKVLLVGPFGDFLIKPSHREMIYLGGGAGMAPLRSHLAYLFETEKTTRKVSYWYGARSRADLFYQDYFENLMSNTMNFSFHVALSDPKKEDNWNGHTGFIHEVLYQNYLKNHPAPNEVDYYLCGPPAMIRAGMDMLNRSGIKEDHIVFDEF